MENFNADFLLPNCLLIIAKLLGHFHPILVHLPIGILLLAVLFHFLSFKTKYQWLKPAVKLSLLIGTISAIASCITGYLLSIAGEYNQALVSKHQWFGIGLSVVSLVVYYFYDKNAKLAKWLTPLLGVLIFITGHLGGSLTHGEDYLTQSFNSKSNEKVVNKPIANVQQAIAYNDIIQPILQEKCYSCHGSAKQKANLRLDEPSLILKGAEDGKVVIPGSAGESELIKRLLLPTDNKEHMPPIQKPQLTQQQIELIHWWITNGATFDKKVAELPQPEKIKTYLTALQSGQQLQKIATTDIPNNQVEKVPDSVIKKLLKMDISVNAVAQNSNYLAVSFVTIDTITNEQLQLLKPLYNQIIWLKVGGVKLNDSVINAISNLKSLTRLNLNNTNFSDKNLPYLKNLSQLQYLNFSNTNVTANGVNTLSSLKNLKQLFLYKTNISPDGLSMLKKTFSQTNIDTGGYKLQYLATDTIKLK